MRFRAGTGLLVALLILDLGYFWSRAALPQQGPPAFFVAEQQKIWVELAAGFPMAGIHQINDGVAPCTVIQMTGLDVDANLSNTPDARRPLVSGERLEIIKNCDKVIEIKRDFMPAGRRLALGVPLHVDRMAMEDWLVLPGVGAVIAQRIEENRQQNGDFGTLEGVVRVRGVGRRLIRSWSNYFSSHGEI